MQRDPPLGSPEDQPPMPGGLAAELSAPLLGGSGCTGEPSSELKCDSAHGPLARLPPSAVAHLHCEHAPPSGGWAPPRSLSPQNSRRRQLSHVSECSERLSSPARPRRARAHSDDHRQAPHPGSLRGQSRSSAALGGFYRRSGSFNSSVGAKKGSTFPSVQGSQVTSRSGSSNTLNEADGREERWDTTDIWRRCSSYGGTFDLSRISPELAQVAVCVAEESPRLDDDISRFNSPVPMGSWEAHQDMQGIPAKNIQVKAVLRNQLLEKWANLLIVDPSTSKWVGTWDLVGVVTLLVVAFVQPFQTAFGDSELLVFRFLNGAVFLIFFFDMLLQFFIAYPNSEHPDIFVRDPRGIVKRYLRSWFIVDFLSSSPLELYYWSTGKTGQRSIRVMRLLRLVRLLRLTHLRRLQRRLAVNWGLSNAVVSLTKFMGFTVLWCHWMACLWGGVALSTVWFPSEDTGSWLDHLIESKGVNAECYKSPRAVYGISLYWAIMTFTSIGYGDITPQSEIEYWVASLCMAGMAACWAYIIGQVCGIMTAMQRSTKFKQTMDQLNWIMEDRDCPQELREQLRRYVMETAELKRFEDNKVILQQLSPMLQGKISMHLHHGWIEKVWYLQNIPNKEIIIGICRRLVTMVFAPSEEIYVDRTLFIVRRGLCIRKGRILCNGDVWGEDMVLSNEYLRERYFVRAATYLEVIMLSFADLDQVVDCFPEERAKLRSIQISIAIKAAFIRIAQGIRHLEEEHGVDRSQLTVGQRRRLVAEVLGGTFMGTLSEDEQQDAMQLHMDQCLEQAKQELTCGTIHRHLEALPHGGAHPSLEGPVPFARQISRPDDAMASNMAAMADLVKELAMKVDCLLLKDEMQAQRQARRNHTRTASWGKNLGDLTPKPDDSSPFDGQALARCISAETARPAPSSLSDGLCFARSLSASPTGV